MKTAKKKTFCYNKFSNCIEDTRQIFKLRTIKLLGIGKRSKALSIPNLSSYCNQIDHPSPLTVVEQFNQFFLSMGFTKQKIRIT